MFGSKPLSLPSPFLSDRRTQHLYTEPARQQLQLQSQSQPPSGPCHYQILHVGSRDQKCSCQGYQHNRHASGSVCDCSHAACFHANSSQSENLLSQESAVGGGSDLSDLLDRVRRLEEALQNEREVRASILARERQQWESEIRALREALDPFYRSEQEMQQRLTDVEHKLDENFNEQVRLKTRLISIEGVGAASSHLTRRASDEGHPADQRVNPSMASFGPNDTPGLYSGSETRGSVSTGPSSPRPFNNTVEQDEPRSSGILNLSEMPRMAAGTRCVVLPRLSSPPAEPEEPRSSGFLELDLKEIVRRRRQTAASQPAQAYQSPASSGTDSPPVTHGRNPTPQSLPGISPPHPHRNGNLNEFEDRTYKKRKHQTDLIALDVLADVSAASPVIS